MLGGVFVLGSQAPLPGTRDSGALKERTQPPPPAPDSLKPESYSKVPAPGARTLASAGRLRAYPGAPPAIPHRLLDSAAWGGRGCLICHRDGGFVPLFKAMAPVTPHPGFTSCLQCHVAKEENAGLFRPTSFTPVPPPENGPALPGSPPPVPHETDTRTNCLACHSGPGAVRELRMSHPERHNCSQCHVAREVNGAVFRRGPE